MGESYTNVTEGSGKKQHSWQRTVGANNVEDNVLVEGEPYLAAYMVATQGNLCTTIDSHLLQIMAGSSLHVRVRRIEVIQWTVATTVQFMPLQLRRVTTAGTGGGAPGTAPLDTGDAASGAVSMTLPTGKGTESTILAYARPWVMQTLAVSSAMANPVAVWDFDQLRSKPLIIAAGTSNGIVVKNLAADANLQLAFNVWITETSFL